MGDNEIASKNNDEKYEVGKEEKNGNSPTVHGQEAPPKREGNHSNKERNGQGKTESIRMDNDGERHGFTCVPQREEKDGAKVGSQPWYRPGWTTRPGNLWWLYRPNIRTQTNAFEMSGGERNVKAVEEGNYGAEGAALPSPARAAAG